MKRQHVLIIYVISIIIILFGISNFFNEGLIRVIYHKSSENIYAGYKPSFGSIAQIVCDTNDNIYVIADQSNSLTALNPDGKVIYSYLFPVSFNGSGELIALKNGSVIVDYFGAASRYVFRSNMTVMTEKTPNSHNEYLYQDYNSKELYMIGGKKVKNSKGNIISTNWMTSQIYSSNSHGKQERIAGNTFIQWTTSAPFPAVIWILIGASINSYFGKKLKKMENPYPN